MFPPFINLSPEEVSEDNTKTMLILGSIFAILIFISQVASRALISLKSIQEIPGKSRELMSNKGLALLTIVRMTSSIIGRLIGFSDHFYQIMFLASLTSIPSIIILRFHPGAYEYFMTRHPKIKALKTKTTKFMSIEDRFQGTVQCCIDQEMPHDHVEDPPIVQENGQNFALNFVQEPAEDHDHQHHAHVQDIDKDNVQDQMANLNQSFLFRSRSVPDCILTATEKKVMKTKSIPNDLNKQFKNGEPVTEVVEKKKFHLRTKENSILERPEITNEITSVEV